MAGESYSRAQVVIYTRERQELDEILDAMLADGQHGAAFKVHIDEVAAAAAPRTVRSFFKKVVA